MILFPFGLLTAWLESYSPLQHYSLIPELVLAFLYNVYLVRHYSATPGKLIMGIHIAKVDGAPVGWKEAVLRYAINLVFIVVDRIALSVAVDQLSDTEYNLLSWLERSQQILKLIPAWYQPIRLLLLLWFWSEPIVILTNRSRRALNDFIAGTVLIRGMRH